MITYDFFPLIGGIGRHTHLMYSELKKLDILFFSPAHNTLPRHIRISFWPIKIIKQAGVSLWLHLNAKRIISEHHLEKLNIHSGPGGVLLVRKLPIPVIVTCHHTYKQQYSHIRSQFWKRIFLPFEKRTYRLATKIVCVSEATKHSLVADYSISPGKIDVIHNAVDTACFFPAATQKGPDTIVYVGRIDKRKGIDFLIRSMPTICRQIPDVRLLVAGKGGYLEKMKKYVRQHGLERNVTFLGFVPDEQLNSLYNRARCAVIPSIFEGFGITVIEAIAAGVRVVGTDVDGIREILNSGEYGRMVPYGDHHALAEAIISELRNPQKVQGLRPEYQVAQFGKRYLEILGEVAANR